MKKFILVFICLLISMSCRRLLGTREEISDKEKDEKVIEDQAVKEEIKNEGDSGSSAEVTKKSNKLNLNLSCIQDKLPSEGSPSSILACLAIDPITNKKAILSNFVDFAKFSISTDQSISVKQTLLSNDPSWHVVFTFSSSNFSTLSSSILKSNITLSGRKIGDSDSEDVSVVENLEKITKSPNSFNNTNLRLTNVSSLAMVGPTIGGRSQLACVSKSTADAGLHIGRFLADSGNCTFAYGLGTEKGTNFLFIVSDSLASWKVSTNGAIPSGAIPIGYEYNGAPQYLCRAEVPNEGFIFGKFAQGYDGCNIAGISSYYRITSYLIFSM